MVYVKMVNHFKTSTSHQQKIENQKTLASLSSCSCCLCWSSFCSFCCEKKVECHIKILCTSFTPQLPSFSLNEYFSQWSTNFLSVTLKQMSPCLNSSYSVKLKRLRLCETVNNIMLCPLQAAAKLVFHKENTCSTGLSKSF